MAICPICSKREARLFIRQIDKHTREVVSLDICLDCAVEQGLIPVDGPPLISELLRSDIESILAQALDSAEDPDEDSASPADGSTSSITSFDLSSFAAEEPAAHIPSLPTPPPPPPQPACPTCGSTFAQIKATARFGCDECYETFEDEARGLLLKLHDSPEYVGERPANLDLMRRRRSHLQELRSLLDAQIVLENYEEAARLRDQIQAIEVAEFARLDELLQADEPGPAGGATGEA